MPTAHAARSVTLIVAALVVVPPASGAGDPDPESLSGLPLGYAALAIEAAAGVEVDAAAAALDRIVDAAREGLPAPTPEAALRTVAGAVGRVCNEFAAGRGETLLSEAFASGRCDCDVLTVAYLTAADALDLPLAAVFLPGHALVVWDDGRSTVYWETTVSEARPAWFVEALVPDGADRAYLRPQTRREMIGYFHQIRATYRLVAGDLEAALADYDLAARLTPTLALVHHNGGRANLLVGRYAAALTDFERAVRLDPTYADAHYGRAVALLALDRPREALDAFAAVTELQGAAADVRHMEGLAYVALGDDGAALSRFDASVALDPRSAPVYELRGALHERQGNPEAARRDYRAFVQHAIGTEHAGMIPDVQARLRRLGAG